MKPGVDSKVKQGIKILSWTAISVTVGIFFTSFVWGAGYSRLLELGEAGGEMIASSINGATQETEIIPKYSYFLRDLQVQPKVSAKAYLVGDLNTGEVILSKNQDIVFPIASVSKLMTALVASEITDPVGSAVVSKKALATEGKNGGFRLGETIQAADLVYPLLLESSNDAAEIIAEHFGRDSFVRKMNQQAEILKMSSTTYEDPSGLSSGNKSTVADMFKLTGYLSQKKKELLDITTKRSYSNKKHNWSNISQFLRKDGYLGGKSGYTDEARQTVVSVFSLPLSKSGTRPIAITLLQSQDRAKDVESILKYLSKNVYYGGAADALTDWVKEKVGVPEIRDPDFVTLTFLGDMMLDRGVRNSVVKNFNNDYSKLFEKLDLVNLLKKSDIVFANLEGTASDKGSDAKNLYSFRMDPAVVPAMKGAGIHILSLANNHVGDWGREAYIDTISRLKENEILYTGGGLNKKEAEQPVIVEKYGMKIGYLGFSDVGPRWMEAKGGQASLPANSVSVATSAEETAEAEAGVLLASDPRFDEIVASAAREVDYLVVSFHFGDEYKSEHNARQEQLAQRAIDQGAKIVVGHHPHMIQETETYKNGFIAYSLGNFIFDQGFRKETMEGMILEIKLNRDGSLAVKKNISKLSPFFKPETIIPGKEEKIEWKPIVPPLTNSTQ